MKLSVNQAAMNLIKEFEGCRLTAYQDVGGVWTIGYGHTPAREGQVITQVEANALLSDDVQWAALRVQDECTGPTTPNQFGAMASLCFNIGGGAFAESSVLRYHNEGRYQSAANSFRLWDMVGDRHNYGLLRRRIAEAQLYLKEEA